MKIYEKLGFQNKEQWDFPTIINLNVFRGKCPCNCIHCPVGRVSPTKRYTHFKKSEVSLDLYKKVSNEIASHTDSLLRIHSVGEPILWGGLSEAIKYSKSINVKTWIFTSAVTTNSHLLMELCENTYIIEVSVNSVSKEDYLQSKKGDIWKSTRRYEGNTANAVPIQKSRNNRGSSMCRPHTYVCQHTA